MPVIINEIEVLEKPAPAPTAGAGPSAAPAAVPRDFGERVLQLARDAEGRQRRLVAD